MKIKTIISAVGLALATSSAVADIYISEYIEGSSNNKAIEIFNDSDAPVDLTAYSLAFYFNGNTTAGSTIALTGSINANDVYVIANSNSNAEIIAKADLTTGGSFFNGDDAIELLLNDEVLDAIGQKGVDPGSFWASESGEIKTQNQTLVRIPAISTGDTNSENAFDVGAQWLAFPQDTFSELGMHNGLGGDDDNSGHDNGDDGGDDAGEITLSPLIITGVIDGPLPGGLPKALEIYVTQAVPDLSICGIGSANNGNGGGTQEFTFDGISADAGSFIYVASEATAFAEFFGFAPTFTSGTANVNGDDAFELFCDNLVVDTFGDINQDGTGEPWEYLDGWAYRNANTVNDGARFVIDNWSFSGANALDGEVDNVSAINAFPLQSFEPAQGELFISEYIEGSGSNKVIELYNPSFSSIDLSGYSLSLYSNGSIAPTSEQVLSGEIQAGGTFVISNANAVQEVQALSNLNSSTINFNGDDAFALVKGDAVIDVIGKIGERLVWGSDLTSTQNRTLVRKPTIRSGDTDGTNDFDPSLEWIGFDINTFDNLGMHSTGGTDIGGGGDNGGSSIELGVCSDPATFIHDVQGMTDVSPLVNQPVVVEAVVTAVFPALQGFYVQEEDSQTDANGQTSEGLFVFTGNSEITVSTEQVVRVAGMVAEQFGKTQLVASDISASCGSATASAAQISLPTTSDTQFESVESMLVTNTSAWTITSQFNYPRFGEITLSSERLFTPTHLFQADSAEALALNASNQLDRIILDDNTDGALNASNFDLPLPIGGLSANNPLRNGDQIEQFTAIMDYGFNAYRLRLTSVPNITSVNPRTAAPEIEKGNITLASFNVLNLFNGDGQGSGFPTSRGATNEAEYNLQLEKIAQAIAAIDADAVGLMEIENDGFGENSAIADLVKAVNQIMGEGVYSFVDLGGPVGTDQITVGIIYKASTIVPLEAAKVLSTENSALGEDGQVLFDTRRNRPSLAQLFSVVSNDQEFVLNVNHFKSKGSGCGAGDDSTNGQGNCNGTRTRAAQGLSIWLSQQYQDQPIIVVGDLNSYAKEDPILLLENAGFVDVARVIDGPKAYSYTFSGLAGSLDYALTNALAFDKLVDVTEWHINADESQSLDYNDTLGRGAGEFTKPEILRSTSPYRASDHDPVVATFNFGAVVGELVGDVNGDGQLTFDDYYAIYALFGVSTDNVAFNVEADLDNDGIISFSDLMAWYNIFISQ